MTVGTDVTGGGAPGAAAEPRAALAPVIPLFGDRSGAENSARGVASDAACPVSPRDEPDDDADAPEPVWRSTWEDDVVPIPRRSPGDSDDAGGGGERPPSGASAELAEKHLLKKLRGRSLSIAEGRGVLAAFGATAADADAVIEAFVSRGYLDDAAFAEQLVHVGLDRKGQGRRSIAQSLAKRGIPREVADRALQALPDDDGERALDFARAKARSLASYDRQTALRRLTGQLARRGYGGSMALDAARTALDEVGN